MTAAELEIALHRRDADSYSVDLRFSQPDSEADVRPASVDVARLHVDQDALRQLTADPLAYGRELAQRLFDEAQIGDEFDKARVAAASQEAPLRIRLYIGPSAPELHNLRWETLVDPSADTPLLTNEKIVFSRYLSSLDWRPVRLRPQRELTALTVVANPGDLDRYNLATVDVGQELSTVKSGLGEIASKELTEPGSATLDNIVHQLREEVDILYLVAHGALHKSGEAVLYLEDESGMTKPVRGAELVTRVRELSVCPRLVVLASCQSAGKGDSAVAGDDGALAALGPRLAEAGVPAVLAMQGNVSQETVRQFMPVFFSELRRDGQIDRAMAAARGRVRDRVDWWMPVLYLRLKSGRIWYTSGFGEGQDQRDQMKKWGALKRSILDGSCTPILGPGLTEFLYGSQRDLAVRLAEQRHYPMAPQGREELTQVAQYLNATQDRGYLTGSILSLLAAEIQRRHTDELPEELAERSLKNVSTAQLSNTLAELIEAVARKRRSTLDAEPYQTLARLPFPIYITTDASDLLFQAFEGTGKTPRVEFCRWNQRLVALPLLKDIEPAYSPSPDEPLIYHFFGRTKYPESLVLTEDDFFDYLIGATANKDLIPSSVRAALASTALLFVGFQMEERNFRVLFRSIMGQEGSASLIGQYAHIAAQVTPEEGRILEPTGAQRYLEEYFRQNRQINIYWGDPESFFKDLETAMKTDS